jgi:hypothetical protein
MATSTQNVTNVTSNIGASQQPYYNMAMQGAAGLLTAPVPRYVSTRKDPVTGVVTETPIARIANFTEQQKNLQGQVAGMQTPGQFGQATDFTNQAGVAALNAGNYDPAAQYNATSYAPAAQYTPSQFTTQQIQDQDLNYFQMGPAQQFGNEQVQQYMSPYFQNVLDVQKQRAQEDAQKSQLMQNLGASRQGTYGGSRQLLAGLTRERDLGRQMGDIQAAGQQSAFENAQQQFERDRAAGFNVNNANLNAALGVQELGARNRLQAQLANQQYDFEAQKAGEQSRQYGSDFGEKSRQFGAELGEKSRQFGADFGEKSRQFGAELGLRGAQTAGDMAQTLSNIGSAQQQADAQRIALQQQTAAQEQALNQQKLDLSYSDFQREADNPYTQLQRYMNLMSGVPVATNTTTTTTAPSPSLASQIMGTGLSAASIYNTANRAGVI